MYLSKYTCFHLTVPLCFSLEFFPVQGKTYSPATAGTFTGKPHFAGALLKSSFSMPGLFWVNAEHREEPEVGMLDTAGASLQVGLMPWD